MPLDIKARNSVLDILRKAKEVEFHWMPRGDSVASREVTASVNTLTAGLKALVSKASRKNQHALVITVICDS